MHYFEYNCLAVVCLAYLLQTPEGLSIDSLLPQSWKGDEKQELGSEASQSSAKFNKVQTEVLNDPVCHDTNLIDYALRLKGCGDEIVSQAGRLEIYYKDGWSSVCDDYFDKMDAQVACYSLGFVQNEGLSIGRYFLDGAENVGIVLDDVNCTGTESVLDECPHAIWGTNNCVQQEAVSIACVASDENHFQQFGYLTRIVSGNENITNAGRLEILHRGEWGTVCDDNFNNVDATIACRALSQNFTAGIFARNEYGPGTGRIWLDGLACQEYDKNIGNCAHHPWGVHDCNHEEDVSIICGICFDELCENNSTCIDYDTPKCLCLPGYSGARCETKGSNCQEAPCLNGGECDYWFGRFQCRCPSGFTGEWCETSIAGTTTTTTTPRPSDETSQISI